MLTLEKPRQSRVKPAAVPTDDAAARALAWLEHGEPDAEIVYDDDAPKQTPQELKRFQRRRLIKQTRHD